MFKIPSLSALLGTPVSLFLIGSAHPLMPYLLLLSTLDVITGLTKGLVNADLRSGNMWIGMVKKAGIWVVIIISNVIDVVMATYFHGLPIAKTAAILFYIGMEGISILENLHAMGVTIPTWVGKYLRVIKEKGDMPEEPKIEKVKR